MRIAIDLTATPKNKTGIGRYLLGLISGLQEVDQQNDYLLFLHEDDADGFNLTNSNFIPVTINSRILRHTAIRILWEQFVFPFRLRKLKVDILHCPNFTMPYLRRLICPKVKIISAFHDMTYFFFPEYHVGWKREMFKAYIRLTAKCADKIITISENSKKDIPLYCHPKNPAITVTPMGVDQRFFTSLPPTAEQLSRYGIDKEYILYIGTLEPRKNVPGLILAYSKLPAVIREKYKLVLCGKKGWLYDDIYKSLQGNPELLSSVIFTGYVEDIDLPSLIRGASVFAYISFYEGFGIPVIEGMASGVFTITSYGSSLEEVAGDGALLVDPKDQESITEGLIWALSDKNAKDKTQMIQRGIARAAHYTWTQCATLTISAYQEIYHDR